MRNRAATWVNFVFASIIVVGVFFQVYFIASYAMGAGEGALDAHGFVGGARHPRLRADRLPVRARRVLEELEVDRRLLRALRVRDDPDLPASRPTRIPAAAGCTGSTGCSRCSCSSTRRTSRTATCAGSGSAGAASRRGLRTRRRPSRLLDSPWRPTTPSPTSTSRSSRSRSSGSSTRSRASSRASRPSCACAAAARRASARTSPTRSRSRASSRPRGPKLPLAGSHKLDSFSELVDRLELFPTRAGHGRLLRLPALGASRAPRSTWRCARRAGRSPMPSGASRGRCASSSRWASATRRAAARVRGWLEHYPGLEFKLDPRSSWDEALVAELAELGAVESVDLKGQYSGTIVDQPPDPRALPPRRGGLPRGVHRGPGADRGDRRDPRAAPRPDHLGRDHPLRRRHRRAAVPAADDQHQAVALRERAQRCSTHTTTATSRASGPTAAASSSSARAAARSSTSPRCSIRTRRTTSRPAASTSASRGRACPRARSSRALEPTGFRWTRGLDQRQLAVRLEPGDARRRPAVARRAGRRARDRAARHASRPIRSPSSVPTGSEVERLRIEKSG